MSEEVDEEARAVQARRPFLEIRGELLHHNPSILYFSSISIVQQACGRAALRRTNSCKHCTKKMLSEYSCWAVKQRADN